MKKFILAPSILSADFCKLGEQVELIDKCGAEYIHIDVMDGAFVPSISFGIPIIKSLRKVTNRVFDVHLMIEEPGRYINDFYNAGADLITIHAESCKHLHRTIHAIKEKGMKVGVALNPATPLSTIEYVLQDIDMLLIMSVNPGFGGQKYIEAMTDKIKKAYAMIQEAGLDIDIQVDGGININNVKKIYEAGANIVVAGTAVFGGDIEENVKNIFEEVK